MTILQAIKINAAVVQTTTSTGAFYTAPANAYAILNFWHEAASVGTVVVNIGGQIFYKNVSTGDVSIQGVIVGPGQSVNVSNNPGGHRINVSGVELINTT
jgi:hypothetical protein